MSYEFHPEKCSLGRIRHSKLDYTALSKPTPQCKTSQGLGKLLRILAILLRIDRCAPNSESMDLSFCSPLLLFSRPTRRLVFEPLLWSLMKKAELWYWICKNQRINKTVITESKPMTWLRIHKNENLLLFDLSSEFLYLLELAILYEVDELYFAEYVFTLSILAHNVQ